MNFFVVALFGFFFAVQASPLLSELAPRANLDVFDPTIISPNGSTIWCIGQNETVTWETDNAPKDISNGAFIVLHSLELLLPGIVLAQNFSLLSGSQGVFVPTNVTPGQYEITLFGDSGDVSDPFKVESCDSAGA